MAVKGAIAGRRRAPTMPQFATAMVRWYEESGAHPQTVVKVREVLRVLGQDGSIRTAADIDDDAVRRFAAALEARAELSISSRATWLVQFKAMCGRAVRMGLMPAVPDFPPTIHPRDLKRAERTRAPSTEYVRSLLGDMARADAAAEDGEPSFRAGRIPGVDGRQRAD